MVPSSASHGAQQPLHGQHAAQLDRGRIDFESQVPVAVVGQFHQHGAAAGELALAADAFGRDQGVFGFGIRGLETTRPIVGASPLRAVLAELGANLLLLFGRHKNRRQDACAGRGLHLSEPSLAGLRLAPCVLSSHGSIGILDLALAVVEDVESLADALRVPCVRPPPASWTDTPVQPVPAAIVSSCPSPLRRPVAVRRRPDRRANSERRIDAWRPIARRPGPTVSR